MDKKGCASPVGSMGVAVITAAVLTVAAVVAILFA